MQDVYLKVGQVPEDLHIGAPRAFLFKIAANLVIDLQRKRQRDARAGMGTYAADIDTYSEVIASSDPMQDDQLISRETTQRVLEAIEILPPKTKRVFMLHRFEGLSHSEIARSLSVTTKTVEYHMAQALLKLRRARQDD